MGILLSAIIQIGSSKIKLEPYEWYIIEINDRKDIVEFGFINTQNDYIYFSAGCSLIEKYIYGNYIIHGEKFIKSIKKASINDVPEYFFQQFPSYRPSKETKKEIVIDKNKIVFNIMISSVLLNFIFLIVFIIFYT